MDGAEVYIAVSERLGGEPRAAPRVAYEDRVDRVDRTCARDRWLHAV